MGMQNGTATFEDSLVFSHKIKHILTIWLSDHGPWHLPKGLQNVGPHKNKEYYIHKKQCYWAIKRTNNCYMDGFQKHYAKWIKPRHKRMHTAWCY